MNKGAKSAEPGRQQTGAEQVEVGLSVVLAGSSQQQWEFVKRNLTAHGSFHVVACPGSSCELRQLVRNLDSCIVVADQSLLESRSGAACPITERARTLVVAQKPDAQFIEGCLRNGCWGVIEAPLSDGRLSSAIVALAKGEFWAPRAILTRLVEALSSQIHSGLTRREREILGLVAAGSCNRDIAEKLYISPETVRWHLRSLYKKLGVRDRLGAALCASRLLPLTERALGAGMRTAVRKLVPPPLR